MLHVGLTGNIASGKSNAARVFGELGAHIIDADVIGHSLLARGTATYERVVAAFGTEILDSDDSVRRRVLGEIIFHDAEKRQLLNSIIHPEVRNEVLRRIVELERDRGSGIVIVDAALLVESGFYKTYDKIVVVHCHPSLQLARIISRDGLSLPEARARIASQMPMEQKLQYADYVVDTSGTLRRTREQIEEIYRDLVLVEVRIRTESDS